MTPDDIERLRHMRDAAREALSFIEGKVAEDLMADRLLLLAWSRKSKSSEKQPHAFRSNAGNLRHKSRGKR